jgi:hypothetical protein
MAMTSQIGRVGEVKRMTKANANDRTGENKG